MGSVVVNASCGSPPLVTSVRKTEERTNVEIKRLIIAHSRFILNPSFLGDCIESTIGWKTLVAAVCSAALLVLAVAALLYCCKLHACACTQVLCACVYACK